MAFQAKFGGTCVVCGERYYIGDTVESLNRKIAHLHCAPKFTDTGKSLGFLPVPVGRRSVVGLKWVGLVGDEDVITANRPDPCAKCKSDFPVGTTIVWSEEMKLCWHLTCRPEVYTVVDGVEEDPEWEYTEKEEEDGF